MSKPTLTHRDLAILFETNVDALYGIALQLLTERNTLRAMAAGCACAMARIGGPAARGTLRAVSTIDPATLRLAIEQLTAPDDKQAKTFIQSILPNSARYAGHIGPRSAVGGLQPDRRQI